MSVKVNIPGLVPPKVKNANTGTATPTPTPTQNPTPKAYIMVGTPAYGGLAYVSYVQSLLASMQFLATHGIGIEPCFLTNESLIPRGRNTIVARFMNDKKFTHLLFIDADINWAPQSILKLIQHDRDIVGGLYPKKGYDWQKMTKNKEIIKMVQDATTSNRDLTETEMGHLRAKLMTFVANFEPSNLKIEQGCMMQLKHIGTGFMMIKRSVLEKMADAFPELKYDDDINVLRGNENNYLYAFFDCEIHKLGEKKHYLSEDYLFCKRWTDLGGKIYADITIPLTHTGTHAFAGNFAVAHNLTQLPSPPPPAKVEEKAKEDDIEVEEIEPKMTIQRNPSEIFRKITTINQATATAPL